MKNNYLSLLKGKISADTHHQSKSRELRRESSFDPSKTSFIKDEKFYSVGKKKAANREEPRDNNAIRNRYKEKYGNSIVSRSVSKTRNNSIKNGLNEPSPNSREKRRNSTYRKITGQYDINGSKNLDARNASKTLYIGSENPYEKSLNGKWKQSPFNSPTMDLKEKEKPYFNRRAMYRK